jgi:hypothetical protein
LARSALDLQSQQYEADEVFHDKSSSLENLQEKWKMTHSDTRLAFDLGQQNWFICILGFVHYRVRPDKANLKAKCPLCSWTFEHEDAGILSEKEEDHLILKHLRQTEAIPL